MQRETHTEIGFVMIRTMKPHVGQDFRAFDEDAHTCSRDEALFDDSNFVPQGRESSGILGPGPAEAFVNLGRGCEPVREKLQDHHAGNAEEWRGDQGVYCEDRRIKDADFLDLACQTSPPAAARGGAGG